jgi:protein gp37
MAENSKIEWTNHTANLWWGCTKVHAGCDNCYALAFAKRVGNDIWGNDKPRREIVDVWNKLKKWQKDAKESGEVHRVFVGSMMDIFEKPMKLVNHKGVEKDGNTGALRKKFFDEVVPNSPNLQFLLLTKRPSNINKYIPESWKENPPENVMFGTSPVSMSTFKTLSKQLKSVNGKRFFSIEPQLEEIKDIDLSGIDWVIQGGESGHHKRPFNTDWGRTMKSICKEQKVPYFFKQVDKIREIPDDLKIREFPEI